MAGRGDTPSRVRGFVWAGAMALTLLAAPASAEILLFTNGRSVTVTGARFEDDSVVLTMPGGTTIRVARSIVQDLLPDQAALARALAERARLQLAAAPEPPDHSEIRALVDQVAARVGLDRRLAHAVVGTESNYQPFAISPRGAVGLMQIMPALVRQYGLQDPFDPAHNLEAGMKHLRGLLDRFDIRNALAAYNAGEGAVARYNGVPPFRETQSFVRRILAAIR